MIFLQWLGKQESFLDDLHSLDPDLWQGLVNLKHCADNLQDLSVNFTVAVKGGPLALPPYHALMLFPQKTRLTT